VFLIFGTLAEFERRLVQEPTRAGLDATRARDRMGGRLKRLDATKRRHAVELYRS
jgi:DNA invertase Pin-like site-specific DNA recombinase